MRSSAFFANPNMELGGATCEAIVTQPNVSFRCAPLVRSADIVYSSVCQSMAEAAMAQEAAAPAMHHSWLLSWNRLQTSRRQPVQAMMTIRIIVAHGRDIQKQNIIQLGAGGFPGHVFGPKSTEKK